MSNKIILFIGYWGANDGLTSATILPHLKILSELKSVDKIIFCSIEREKETEFNIKIPKVSHQPLYTSFDKIPLVNKISDFILFPKKLIEICETYSISHIIARGATAGSLAYKTWVKTKIPFFVESFEPHAEYMLESDVWTKNDIRYRFQKKWEEKQKKYASGLMPVSNNYYNLLIEEGLDEEKQDVIPCCTDMQQFEFSERDRKRIKKGLKISSNSTVGIYVGKFGGIYYEKEAFVIFKKIADLYSNFHLIILTPEEKEKIEILAKEINFPLNKLTITKVGHKEVANYLSASDIAFATIKPSKHRKYCSPVKTGEYWANGLPVIITPNVGDDSIIINNSNAGLVVDVETEVKKKDLNFISRKEIKELAKEHRSFNIARSVYEKWYS